ncbi:MAG: lipopolysaccharide biosynthesis protein [Sedimentisphaerales bacterium]|nr:lipopolysaccharide biosynthesis protein [Sedimentisphaerales bacterium]HOH63402.1 lipopolysaccharide biosynthesis protein [Sedimentisphaerales bacterium]HQN34344.1 lipopolysaccharide biosynthesis protein [Sedimentisphaerales bacterium]
MTAGRTKRASALSETATSSDWRWPRLGVLASSRFRRLSREFLWIGVGQAATVLGAVVGIRILTAVLPPDSYGRLALGMTVATLATQTVLGPLGNAAMRFFAPAREAGALRSYFAAVKRLLLEASGAMGVLAFVLILILDLTGHWEWVGLVLAATLFALVSGYNSVLNGMQNAARQRAIVALHHGLATWGRFLLAAGMVLWLGAGTTIAMLGYAAAMIIVLGSQGWFFRRTLSCGQACVPSEAPQERWRIEILTYAWPFAIWGFPAWVQMVSDRWALQGFCSTEDVGRYAALYQLGYYPITICTNLMVQLVAPVFFQRAGDASDLSRVERVYRLNRKLTVAALALTAVATLMAWAWHDPIVRFLVAAEYRTISGLLPGMVLAGGLFASGQLAVVSLLSGVQTRALVLPKVATAVLGVVLNILGAALFGTPGVVAAMVLAAAVYLIWILCLAALRPRHVQAGASP